MKVAPILLCAGILISNTALADNDQDAWQHMETQNFIIYYRADVSEEFVQTTMDTAEVEFSRIAGNLGISNDQNWSWDKQAKIYIYSDHDDYVKNGGQAGWSHGVAFARAKTIKTFPEASGFFDTILPHELGHIIFRDYIGFTEELPLWFEEGVAIYQEKAKRVGSDKIVLDSIENGEFIPLTQLTGMRLYKDSKSQVVDLFYMESASAVHCLIRELGDQGFYNFLNDLKENMPFVEAIQKELRVKDIDELNQTWVDYLQG